MGRPGTVKCEEHLAVISSTKNDVGKAMGSIPNFTTNGWYKPSKYGWFLIVFLTSSNKNEEITMKEDMWGYYITNNIKP